MPRFEPGAWLGVGATAVSCLTLAGYFSILLDQRESDWDRVAAVTALIVVAAVGTFVGGLVLRGGRSRTATLTAAAAVFFVLGMVGIFSIGLPLLVAGGLAVAAAARSGAGADVPRLLVLAGVAGALPLALALLIGALSLTG